MKTIKIYELGDIVKVVDIVKRYESYETMFKTYHMSSPAFYDFDALGFKELREGYLYQVIRQVPHLLDPDKQLVFIKDKSGYVYLIDFDGVELYRPQVISWA